MKSNIVHVTVISPCDPTVGFPRIKHISSHSISFNCFEYPRLKNFRAIQFLEECSNSRYSSKKCMPCWFGAFCDKLDPSKSVLYVGIRNFGKKWMARNMFYTWDFAYEKISRTSTIFYFMFPPEL